MSIKTLPDVSILVMFSYLPVADLLTIDRVYSHWKSLQQTEFLRRRELTILIGSSDCSPITNSRYAMPFVKELADSGDDTALGMAAQLPACNSTEWSFLRYDELNDKNARFLVKTFPNISRLGISQNGILSDQVCYLFVTWSTSLTSLKMWYTNGVLLPNLNLVEGQLSTINFLPSLEHLSLEFDRFAEFYEDLSILQRLSDVSIYYPYSCSKDLYESLKKYAVPNEKLKQIDIKIPWVFSLDEFTFEPDFFTRFTSFEFQFDNGSMIDFDAVSDSILAKFTSLTSLEIILNESIVQMARRLLPLKQLIYLTLVLLSDSNDYETVCAESIPQLNSVKVLKLSVYITNISLEQSSGLCFPNLFAIEFEIDFDFTCPKCDYCGMKCIRRFLLPFEQCTKVHKFRSRHLHETPFESDWPIACGIC